ncbi:hypothetical protein GGR54DRAFT_408140 [Hypoxylon sp. NC1633]|nr:hypothetical protein GGR54DRAFT_408140 [Hypoxylon sp. NC1633]
MNPLIFYLLASIIIGVSGKDERTFAVLRFNNEAGRFSTEGRMDPIVYPGTAASHSHGVMGGSNFALTVEGDQLLDSKCTNAMIANDKSNYWVPQVWFRSPENGTFMKVPLFYMNAYYFFEATNDEIKPFPPGMKMVSGDASKRTPPASGALQLDPSQGEVLAVQFTCATIDDNVNRYPPDSDGLIAGLQDPNNKGAGAGFPVANCDGYASPLREDIHFPSCLNPETDLDDYKNSMAFPTDAGAGKSDCPKGWTHLPHLFYEVYFDTLQFQNAWVPDGKNQPFVLSNGDRTGFSLHGDFISGWDAETLQTIIDGCDAGTSGMDTCPVIKGGVNSNDKCQILSAFPDPADEWIPELPGNNPLSGWGL